jgi:hypothetical protein
MVSMYLVGQLKSMLLLLAAGQVGVFGDALDHNPNEGSYHYKDIPEMLRLSKNTTDAIVAVTTRKSGTPPE